MAGGEWLIYSDGASRGNPGPAAIGAVIFDETGRQVHTVSRRIGHATNNEAEYQAAIAGLEAALALGARRVELRMDSELVVRQLGFRYRVRNPRLKRLFDRVKDLERRFESFRAAAVPRAQNRQADAQANRALDQRPGETLPG
ncbi:MAG TPA: ribonuclease HI family protein [Dehalococcoidia bacterium]|nr:ribonuclease HI family protein [Dehalococcoidia bacterium]